MNTLKAIIVTGGKQYTVSEGDVIYVEKLNAEAGDAVTFDQVLAIVNGKETVFAKKGYRRTQGHRQPYTKVQIDSITA